MSGGSVATGTSGDLDLGSNVSGKTTQPGTANISGGTLSVGRNINVGDYSAGTFNQTGGFVTGTSPINVSIQAGGGTMNLSGGTLNLALSGDNGNLYNGYHASGAVNISGKQLMSGFRPSTWEEQVPSRVPAVFNVLQPSTVGRSAPTLLSITEEEWTPNTVYFPTAACCRPAR